MVKLHLKQRLGNNMFQYALARLLADGLGCSLLTVSRTHPDVDFSGFFPRAPLTLARFGYRHSAESLRLTHHFREACPDIDFPAILNKRPKEIIVSGYFESYEHLAPYGQQLREMYARTIPVRHDRVCVHLRLGDEAENTASIPDYVDVAADVCRRHPGVPVDMVAESPDHPFAQESLRRLRGMISWPASLVHHPHVITTFDYLRGARALVSANSTLCWWAGFLAPRMDVYVALSQRQRHSQLHHRRYLAKSPDNFTIIDIDRRAILLRGRNAPMGLQFRWINQSRR